jgi:hypothetical protein
MATLDTVPIPQNKNLPQFCHEITELIKLLRNTPLTYSRLSEKQQLEVKVKNALQFIVSGLVHTKEHTFKMIGLMIDFEDIKDILQFIPDEIINDIYFWCLLCCYFQDEVLNFDKCITVVNSTENTDGLTKWLYFNGSALVYPEYYSLITKISQSDLEIACYSMSSYKNSLNKLIKHIPDNKKSLKVWCISAWRHSDCVFNRLHPDEDFLLGHIPDEIKHNNKFIEALECGKCELRLPDDFFLDPVFI